MSNVKIYRPSVVASIQQYYGDLVLPKCDVLVKDHLETIASALFEGLRKQVNCLYSEINNYHPNYLGVSIDKLQRVKFTLDDCKQTIASEYGFQKWEDIQSLGSQKYNIQFEQAVEAILNGDEAQLVHLLTENPDIINQKSSYGHGAYLMHYLASNGIELWRQQVPMNLFSIANILLEHGGDKTSKMQVYGGNFTTLELLMTSAHPKEIGLELKVGAILK